MTVVTCEGIESNQKWKRQAKRAIEELHQMTFVQCNLQIQSNGYKQVCTLNYSNLSFCNIINLSNSTGPLPMVICKPICQLQTNHKPKIISSLNTFFIVSYQYHSYLGQCPSPYRLDNFKHKNTASVLRKKFGRK